jgi:hypothetical protein
MLKNEKVVSFADGYKIRLELDTRSLVEITCSGPYKWQRVVFGWNSRYWRLKNVPKALQEALAMIKKRRAEVEKFNEETVPDFEALCEVTQAVAELEAELS